MGKYSQTRQKKKSGKGFVIFLVVVLLVLAAAVGGAVWVLMNYHIISGKFYSKDLSVLDLREEAVNPKYIEKLSEKMPDTEIRWSIPFQGGTLADDVTEITVSTLTEKDLEALSYARQLQTVNAEGCTDYGVLELLRQQRPELEVRYSVAFSQDRYSWDVDTVLLHDAAETDIPLLQHLPNLKTVAIAAGDAPMTAVAGIQAAAHQRGLAFGVQMGGDICLDTETSLTVTGITDAEVRMLPLFTQAEQVRLVNPAASVETLREVRDGYPEDAAMDFSWAVELGGQTFESTVTEVDLTMVEITDLAEVEQKMAYLPELTAVTFGVCGVDNENWGNSRSKLAASPIANEEMAAYRDRVRDQYKVVWTVRLGPNIALATNADNFMPNHFGVGQLPDEYAYNLRYCEEPHF